jgi:Fur family peroxide stress response transcriptional regulator
MVDLKNKNLQAIFKKNRLKLTPQRLAIYKLINSRLDHPSTEEIYKSLKKEYPTISLGTVYKTLHLFKDLRLIQELNFSDGNIRYDPNTNLHINLICYKCGKITDYNSEKVKEFWRVIVSDLNFEPKGQRIDLYYDCIECK